MTIRVLACTAVAALGFSLMPVATAHDPHPAPAGPAAPVGPSHGQAYSYAAPQVVPVQSVPGHACGCTPARKAGLLSGLGRFRRDK